MQEPPENARADDWHALTKAWPHLPRRSRHAILVLAGVRHLARRETASIERHTKPGQTPDWMALALNLLKDSSGYLTDREIAQRLRVSPSTLSRNEAYQHARKTYMQEIRRVVRGSRRGSAPGA